LPFSRSTLEYAIDRVLDELDGLGAALPELPRPTNIVPTSLVVAVTVLALDLAIRLRHSRGNGIETDVDEGLVLFPGLPGLRRL
jgi:hypothetical protein